MKRLTTSDLLAHVESVARRPITPATDDDVAAEVDHHLAAIRAERWAALAPALYADATLDGVPAAVDLAGWVERVAAGEHLNALILGPVGTGKTWASWAALRALLDLGIDARGVTTSDLLEAHRPDGPGPGPYLGARVLLIDDIAAERRTDWTADVLARVIDRRHNDRRTTIITANLTTEALAAWVGERAWSRLSGNALAWWLDGPDRRRTK